MCLSKRAKVENHLGMVGGGLWRRRLFDLSPLRLWSSYGSWFHPTRPLRLAHLWAHDEHRWGPDGALGPWAPWGPPEVTCGTNSGVKLKVFQETYIERESERDVAFTEANPWARKCLGNLIGNRSARVCSGSRLCVSACLRMSVRVHLAPQSHPYV